MKTVRRIIQKIGRTRVLGRLLLVGGVLALFSCSAYQDRDSGNVKETAAISTDRTASALPAWPHEQSDLEPDPALHFGRLENGFRYVLMQNRNPENRVSMHLNVQAGSMQEQDGQDADPDQHADDHPYAATHRDPNTSASAGHRGKNRFYPAQRDQYQQRGWQRSTKTDF